MPILSRILDLVPIEEVAEAARRAPGEPHAVIGASGWHLATALDVADFRVVRDAAPGPKLTFLL